MTPKPTPEQHLRKHIIWAHGKVAVFSPPDAATGGNIALMAADTLAEKDAEIERLQRLNSALRHRLDQAYAFKAGIADLPAEDHGPFWFVPCGHCGGSGVIGRRVTVYEHGCGFPHDDTEESPCPECDGTGWTC
jgi:hypothetical protein